MSSAVKKELILEGLDCAHCASKIEEKVQKISGVASAVLHFPTKTLTISAVKEDEIAGIVQSAGKIIKELEPHVLVLEKDRRNETPEPEDFGTAKLLLTGAGAVLFAVALIFSFPYWIRFGIYLGAYILVGGEVLLTAGRNILKGRVFDENFLMSLATIGAFAIGEFPEGVAVMLFYQIGEFFQARAVNRSRKSIAALMDIRPDYANLKTAAGEKRVTPEEVRVGDIILVKPGEKVPLDGSVIEGRSMLDTSALTGESVPRDVEPGSEVLSGSINKNGLLTIRVTKVYGESTVSKILDLVQNAAGKKAVAENFITKFARYYTPAVVFIAVLLAVLPPLFIPGTTFSDWLGRALVFLVVSCPCALVISIPLSFFGGIGAASRNGILVKGGNFLEALNKVDTVVFDKTGTLTKGVFEVTNIHRAENTEKIDVLEYAAYAESYSTHPIAQSIVKAYGRAVAQQDISDYEELPGYGVRAFVRGRRVLAGNRKLMTMEHISFVAPDEAGTAVHVAVDGTYAGTIIISDRLKSDSKNAVAALKRIGVRQLVMLTGDSRAVGDAIGQELGLDQVHAELLPDQKVWQLEILDAAKPKGGKLVFMGDGINDAPVLARADVGVAMGGVGSDAAIEAADIVLMTDEPSKLVTAIKIAKRTRNIVWQNIIFAMGVKLIVLALGAGGIATIWEAVFADVGVALIAVLNAIRVLRTETI